MKALICEAEKTVRRIRCIYEQMRTADTKGVQMQQDVREELDMRSRFPPSSSRRHATAAKQEREEAAAPHGGGVATGVSSSQPPGAVKADLERRRAEDEVPERHARYSPKFLQITCMPLSSTKKDARSSGNSQ